MLKYIKLYIEKFLQSRSPNLKIAVERLLCGRPMSGSQEHSGNAVPR